MGIPETSIVRLGGQSTQRTAALALQKQTRFKRTQADWKEIDRLRGLAQQHSDRLDRNFEEYKSLYKANLLQHLEFHHAAYFGAFRVPQSADGMRRVAKKGRAAGPGYLLDRWRQGQDAGIFKDASHVREASDIWMMPSKSRRTLVWRWMQEVLKDLIERFCTTGDAYNGYQRQLDRKYGENDAAVLRSKRIIGCTTTGAAKYRNDIDAARPGVLLVEEAGEILESHILTSLGAETKQLILIGDHKCATPH